MRRGICGNSNKFLVGPSGTGKSFFVNLIARQYYEQGTHVVIVDIGNSYKGLCELIRNRTNGRDGFYFEYSENDPVSFNPFYCADKLYDVETRESIKTLLMTLWKRDDEPPTRAEEVALSNAVNLYLILVQNGQVIPCFNTFYDYLRTDYRTVLDHKNVREKDFDLENLLNVLEPFYKGGEYELLLNSDKQLDLHAGRFMVFELGNIKDNPILFAVTTLVIMSTFINKMRRLQGVRKAFFCDEAWQCVARTGMASFIKFLYKTGRKHFCEIVTITQEINDIVTSPIVRESIVANSDIKILLDMKKYMQRFDEIQELLGLSAKEKNQILSLNQSNDPTRRYKEV